MQRKRLWCEKLELCFCSKETGEEEEEDEDEEEEEMMMSYFCLGGFTLPIHTHKKHMYIIVLLSIADTRPGPRVCLLAQKSLRRPGRGQVVSQA